MEKSRPSSVERLRMQSELLHPPVTDLPHVEFVLVAAIDGVDGAEFLRQLPRSAELAYNLARQFQLVDLAVRVDVVRRVRVRAVEVLDVVRA